MINVLAKTAQVFGVWRAPPGVEHMNIESPHHNDKSSSGDIKEDSRENRKRARKEGQYEDDGQHSSEDILIKRGKHGQENDNEGQGSGELSDSHNGARKNNGKRRGASIGNEKDKARSQVADGLSRSVKEEN